MKRRKKVILLVFLLIVLGSGSWCAYAAYVSATRTVPNAYAVWRAADIVVQFMASHNGDWPKSWDDLRGPYEEVERITGSRPYPLTFGEVRQRVEIDFSAAPAVLAKARPSWNTPPFRVIHLRSGGTEFWQGHEPNTMILEYLRDRQASRPSGAATSPSSSSAQGKAEQP